MVKTRIPGPKRRTVGDNNDGKKLSDGDLEVFYKFLTLVYLSHLVGILMSFKFYLNNRILLEID